MKRILIIMVILPFFASIAFSEDYIIISGDNATETIVTFPSSINESSLIEDYIISVMPHKNDGRLRAARPSGLSLTGPSRRLYRLLADRIASIASGEESSTVFTFTPSDIYEKTIYAAEDLGVSYIKDENGFNPEAVTAMQSIRKQLNFPNVIACLMSDFPLQMYWFGEGYATGNCSISGTTDNLKLTGTVMFKMRVAEDYATKSVTEDGTIIYNSYEVDTSYGQAVQNAANNAAEILDRYAGQNDYEMLKSFRDEIRTLTSFNFPAAQGDYQFSYGNPWQIIWVFDGDPETTVVCEGYAKAFQYLVEQGTKTAVAISVQGYLNQIDADHAHMWNVVRIEGHNYLVDVTNDIGYRLFMVGGDGNVNDGYSIGGFSYFYNNTYTYRMDEELTIEPFSYSEWKTATTTAPVVQASCSKVYPGYQIAIKVECGALPTEDVVIHTADMEDIFKPTDGTILLGFTEDTEFTISAIVDGITTPETSTIQINAAEYPDSIFSLPSGANIETEAFTDTDAELIQIHGNQVAAGAFDPDVVLAVDEIGDWFGSGYQFVVVVGEEGTDD